MFYIGLGFGISKKVLQSCFICYFVSQEIRVNSGGPRIFSNLTMLLFIYFCNPLSNSATVFCVDATYVTLNRTDTVIK